MQTVHLNSAPCWADDEYLGTCTSYNNKEPETVWRKTTEIYSLTVKETRSPKSRCWQGWFLLEALRENLFHASLPAYVVTSNRWFMDTSFQSLPLSSHSVLPCVSAPISSSYKETSHWIGAHPNPV